MPPRIAFVAADRAIAGFPYQSSPKTWLYAIAINACRSRLRKYKTQRALLDTVKSIQDPCLSASLHQKTRSSHPNRMPGCETPFANWMKNIACRSCCIIWKIYPYEISRTSWGLTRVRSILACFMPAISC
jgi:hypothetical protein